MLSLIYTERERNRFEGMSEREKKPLLNNMRYEKKPFCAVVCVRSESDTTNTSKKLFSGKRASDRNLKFKMRKRSWTKRSAREC